MRTRDHVQTKGPPGFELLNCLDIAAFRPYTNVPCCDARDHVQTLCVQLALLPRDSSALELQNLLLVGVSTSLIIPTQTHDHGRGDAELPVT